MVCASNMSRGLQEKNDQFTVAFDQTLNPGGALGNVVNP
jgi:hypothetical protein